MANLFDEMAEQLVEVFKALKSLQDDVRRLDGRVERLQDPAPRWEPILIACRKRRVGRKRLLAAVADGRVKSLRRMGQGGHQQWLLCLEDLDTHFPALTRLPEKNPGAIPPLPGQTTQPVSPAPMDGAPSEPATGTTV